MSSNKDLYTTTLESYGVKKPSKILRDQARNVSNGIKPDMKLIKMEIARSLLLEKPSVTAKQQQKINDLTARIDEHMNKPKPPSKRNIPIDPRKKVTQTESKEVTI